MGVKMIETKDNGDGTVTFRYTYDTSTNSTTNYNWQYIYDTNLSPTINVDAKEICIDLGPALLIFKTDLSVTETLSLCTTGAKVAFEVVSIEHRDKLCIVLKLSRIE